MKRVLGLILTLVLVFTSAVGCAGVVGGAAATPSPGQVTPVASSGQAKPNATATTIPVKAKAVSTPQNVVATRASNAAATTITLDDKITVKGAGASVSGSTVQITAGGVYNIRGTLADGQIIVNSQDKETVKLVLDGVDITSVTSAPIYVLAAQKAVITLADDSKNHLTDGRPKATDDAAENEPNAAIFGKSDLTINGNGSLTVTANHDHGIVSKDDLKINGGTITINSLGDGMRGRDRIVVTDGVITIKAAADGLQSNNAEDPEKGTISIEGGTINITAGLDAIQAETKVAIRDGKITLSSGGGSSSSSRVSNPANRGGGRPPTTSASTVSTKGIKAKVDVTIDGGTIKIDSADDSIHSNHSVTINGGDITLASGDDGMHADASLAIRGGQVTITKSYEGLESAVIKIEGGNIHVVASDDGINVVGGAAAFAARGRPGQNPLAPGQSPFAVASPYYLNITGGYIAVDALGDGLDINGSISMTAGVVIVNGPTDNFNGAVDYDGTFRMTGGFLVAVGSAGMAQAPDTSSTQYALLVNLPSVQPAKSAIRIESDQGEEVLTFVPLRQYQSVVLCSPKLTRGATYLVYTGGSVSGAATDGLYSGAKYTGGVQAYSLTISSIVTRAGSGSGGMMPGGGGIIPGGGRR